VNLGVNFNGTFFDNKKAWILNAQDDDGDGLSFSVSKDFYSFHFCLSMGVCHNANSFAILSSMGTEFSDVPPTRLCVCVFECKGAVLEFDNFV